MTSDEFHDNASCPECRESIQSEDGLLPKGGWYTKDGPGAHLIAPNPFGLNPRALFSERREMARMGPMRLGFYLVLRSFILPADDPKKLPSRAVRLRWSVWRYVRGMATT